MTARNWTRWCVVVVFAAAMAWVESACVYYLRVMVDRVEPYQANPLPMRGNLGPIELVREAATLVMLATIGTLAGSTRRTRIAYTAIAFGVWDILYYVFLKAMCDWPRSLFDWDILFLLPLPWWGPVIAPVSIALLMIVWGTLVTQPAETDARMPAPSQWWPLAWLGVALALYAFMADSLRIAHKGADALQAMLPSTFNWSVFLAALVLMAAPILQIAWSVRRAARAN